MAKIIQTIYKGYHFRSRTEARWAVFFDSAKIQYTYEPEGYVFNHNGKEETYLPDFRLHNIYSQENLLLEVKDEDFYNSNEYWKYYEKLESFCENLNFRVILCCGIPKPKAYPIIYGKSNNNDVCFTYFTTDHGLSEVKGGIKNGQYRLWSGASEDDDVDELKDICAIAQKARFEHGEKPAT